MAISLFGEGGRPAPPSSTTRILDHPHVRAGMARFAAHSARDVADLIRESFQLRELAEMQEAIARQLDAIAEAAS